MEQVERRVGAVVMAAGLSRRMGRPKMLLSWGLTTVIGRVVDVLLHAAVHPVVVVTGGAAAQVEAALHKLPVRTVRSPDPDSGEMLASCQIGLAALGDSVSAALVVLGDQPQVRVEVVESMIEAYHTAGHQLIVPSFQHRRGHPWLVERSLWPAVLALRAPSTLRDFLNQHAGLIHYLNVDTPSVLADLDTPEDYQREQRGGET